MGLLPATAVQPHDNWRLGLFSHLHSNAVMRQIYAVLRSHGMRWKVGRRRAGPRRLSAGE